MVRIVRIPPLLSGGGGGGLGGVRGCVGGFGMV